MLPKLVLFDRDDTLIDNRNGHVHKIEDLQWISGALDLIKTLKEYGIRIAVVTNQSGVAKGFYTEEDVVKFHRHMNNSDNADGGIDLFIYCPHHPQGSILKYRLTCNCRKPEPGMLKDALDYFNVSPNETLLFGDALTDVQAGISIGIDSTLVRVGEIRDATLKRLLARC